MSSILHLFLLLAQLATGSQCSRCGTVEIPFPFYLLDNSCATTASPISAAFSLSCIHSSALFLSVSGRSYRLLRFFPDGVLLDFSNATAAACRPYSDLDRSFPFAGDEHFGISTDNVLDLYDCEDSSPCKTVCETTTVTASPDGCDGGGHPSCCYPLSDGGAWRPGESLSVFASKFGCRGFASRVVLPGSTVEKRGIKLEWAVPVNSTACAAKADVINATSIESGIRCRCREGFTGDGFAVGDGCVKSCFEDGKESRGDDCRPHHHRTWKAVISAGSFSEPPGVITSALALMYFTLFYLLKRPVRPEKFSIPDQTHSQNLPWKTGRSTRLFTYRELEEATKGFLDAQILADGLKSTIYFGSVFTSPHEHSVAIQRAQYRPKPNLASLKSRIEALAAISHPNMARVIGWSSLGPLVVYEYPLNGTLWDHLLVDREDSPPLDWRTRLRIVYETANLLVFLRNQVSPPVSHHDLRSRFIFLETDFSIKLAGFDFQYDETDATSHCTSDVYGLGVILLEIITGRNISLMVDFPAAALQRIKTMTLVEVVDPRLHYHELPPFMREQMEAVADLATRCVLFGADGRLGVADVATELAHLVRDGGPTAGLEETFSNSSLLQMISMSPDSIHGH